MWLIKKLTLSQNYIHQVRKLSQQERYLLSEIFIKANEGLTNKEHQTASNILYQARNLDYWIACDCKGEKNPPLLTTVLFESGTLALRKIPRFGEHNLSCDFYRISESSTNSSLSKKNAKPFPVTRFFCEHKYVQTDKVLRQKKPQNTHSDEYEKRLPRLGRKLYTLIHEAKLNHISNEQVPLSLQYQKLISVTEKFNIDEKHKLKDYFWTLPWQKITACQKLKEEALLWSKKSAPQGYFLLIAKSLDVENKKIFVEFRDKKYEFALEKLSLSSGRLGEISAPYLALLTLAEKNPRSKWFDTIKGFAVPVYSENLLCPVESHYERLVLKKLIYLQKHIAAKHIFIQIIKPLFDIPVPSQNPNVKLSCRPDFLLKTSDRTLVIEVMGSDEENYIERKTGTHALMKLIGPIIAFNAHEAQKQNNWEEKLNVMIKQIYAFFLKENNND